MLENVYTAWLLADGTTAATSFLDTPVGKLITTVLGILGFFVALLTIFRVAYDIAKTGFKPEHVKKLLGGLLLAAILFSPSQVTKIANAFSGIFDKTTSTVESTITDSSKNR